MRLLTNSINKKYGLEMIHESDSNDSQNVVFCIPIDDYEAKEINSISELKNRLKGGIVAKILRSGKSEIISFKLKSGLFNNNFELYAKILNQDVRFYVSKLNSNFKDNNFSINHFYAGSNYKSDFRNTRFLILEPNLIDLDNLYLKHKIIFKDFNE